MFTQHAKTADKEKSFSQNAKTFFNTYPKRDGLDCKEKVKELVLSKLNDLKAKLKYILVSYEIGKKEKSVKYEEIRDKEKDCKKYEHYHVLVKFDRQVRIRDAHFWDLDGVHGHYKLLDKKRDSFENTRSYCKKDGDYLEEIGKANPKNGTDFRKALAKAIFKNPLIIDNMERFAELNDDHDGLIIDDFEFSKLSYEEKLKLLDVETDSTVKVKYGHVIVKAGLPRIVTTCFGLAEFLGYKNEDEIPLEIKKKIVAVEVVDDLRKINDETKEDQV